jgi:diguanylate cyclase (GGDEF)-like protein
VAPATAGHAVAFVWKSEGGRSGSIQPRKGRAVTDQIFKILLVGLEPGFAVDLVLDDGLTVESTTDLDRLSPSDGYAAVVGQPNDSGAAAMVETIRETLPNAAILIVTPPGHHAEGTAALAAGAEDHLVIGELAPGLLSIAVRYAIRARRFRTDLATKDPATGLPNMIGFRSLAEHHIHMAARNATQVVFVFVRFEGLTQATGGGSEAAASMVRDAAAVLMEAVRDADVLARISPDTFCVLLAGATGGVETMVLSRLVESIAIHDARTAGPGPLSLSVGSAAYDPADPRPLDEILGAAQAQLGLGASGP